MEFNAQQVLFEVLFLGKTHIFGSAALSPKVILLSHISKDDNFWSSLSPLLGDTDVGAHGLFCTEFNAQQLLFETFLDTLRIFGSVEA